MLFIAGMVRMLGAEILSVSAEKCSVVAPIRPVIAQQHGFAPDEVICAGRRLAVTRASVMAEAPDGALTHIATLPRAIVPMDPRP